LVPVVVRDEDFDDPAVSGHDPFGTIFESALADFTKEEGVFDLRIRVEDTSANANETTIVKAFTVTPALQRSRAVRH
jgi:hypothetical protein